MTVMCDASDIMRYDRRTPEPYNAALHMKQDTTSIEYSPSNSSQTPLNLPAFASAFITTRL